LHQARGLVFDAGVDELQIEALGASGERERLVDLDASPSRRAQRQAGLVPREARPRPGRGSPAGAGPLARHSSTRTGTPYANPSAYSTSWKFFAISDPSAGRRLRATSSCCGIDRDDL
jgi:hypothetical protein